MKRASIASPFVLALTSCGAPSDSAVEGSLERAWQKETIRMEVDAGILKKDEARSLQAVGSSAQMALGAVRDYAGDTAADIAGDVFGAASEIAGAGNSPSARQAAMMTARDWDVTNLEVLDARASHADYVVRVRYDLSAAIAGRRQTIAKDLTQTTRLEKRDGQWAVAGAQQ